MMSNIRNMLIIIGLVLGLAACGGSGKPDACIVPWPQATPKRVIAGSMVRITDAGLRGCHFKAPQTYTISLLRNADLQHPVEVATVPRVGPTGAFKVTVRVPRTTPTGLAQLVISGPELDRKVACPPNGACRRYGAGVYVR